MSVIKSNFAVKSKYEAFYTGGKIQLSADGLFMFCGCGNKVNILEVATGRVKLNIGEEEDEQISSFCLTPDDQYLIIATQHLLLRQWDWKEKKLIRSWKAIHFAPIVSMGFDCTSTLLATGGADSTIKIWDIEKQYCTHNLKGHQGIISVVAFHPDISRLQLYSAGEDYKVRVWNLTNSKCIAETGAHYSLVTSICFSQDGKTVYTSGRDGVVSIMESNTFSITKTIPVFEVLESVILLPQSCEYPVLNADSEAHHFITAGNKGILRVWNASTGKCVYSTDQVQTKQQQQTKPVTDDQKTEDEGQNLVQMLYNSTNNSVTVVTYDQNISMLTAEKLRLIKQFAGNNDEILDVKYFGETNQYAIVATNSRNIKVFELESWDCEILYGHTDIVLCVEVIEKSDMFISAGKDNTIWLWKINPAQKEAVCLAVCQGHTSAVGALALSRAKAKFFVSGSEDCTLKLWHLPSDPDPSVTMEIHAGVTQKAHDKTISSVAVAPNDKFVASGSMDKTAKLWNAKDLSLIGVMRGHKRGIWCVQFSPIDQILATSSGDGVVKLWALTDFSCVRTFEGHDCAVLKVAFVTRGMQLLSSATNGLVKLWTIKSNECVKTFDEHEDKIWAMAVGETDDTFITGSADSSLIVWQDVTETEEQESRQKQEQFILQEQELSNLIQHKKYLKAIGLAITLEQPFRLLNILKEIMSEDDGADKLHQTCAKLRMDQIDTILRFCGQWNTNSRHCHEAQVVVTAVLKLLPPAQLKQLGNLKSSVESLIPYTERHFKRMSRLVQQAQFLEYTWQCMKGISTDSAIGDVETPYAITSGQSTSTADDSSSSESEEEMQISADDKSQPEKTAFSGDSSNESSSSEEEIVLKTTAKPHTDKQVNIKKYKASEESSSSESLNSEEEAVVKPVSKTKAAKHVDSKMVKKVARKSDVTSEESREVEAVLKTSGKPKPADTNGHVRKLPVSNIKDDTSEESSSSESSDSEEPAVVKTTRKFTTAKVKQVNRRGLNEVTNKKDEGKVNDESKKVPSKRKMSKITNSYTVVKDPKLANNSTFSIDRKGSKLHSDSLDQNQSVGKKQKLSNVNSSRLKKLKRPGK